METIFINKENIKTNEPHEFVLDQQQRLDLDLSIYYTGKNIRTQYKNNKLKIIVLTWNGEFELPAGSYSVSNIQDYIEYIIKNHEILTAILPIYVYINRINNRLVFKIKDGYKLELQTPETMKIFGSIKNLIEKTKSEEKVPSLEVVEVVLVQCNLVDN